MQRSGILFLSKMVSDCTFEDSGGTKGLLIT
jgi:hypothetical protein